MNKRKLLILIPTLLWSFVDTSLAQIGNAASEYLPISASDQQVQATDLAGKHARQKVDLFTGSFAYSLPINCAPARNGSEPDLSLNYSSEGDNGWCGMGWSIEIGSIDRNLRDGFPIQYPAGSLVLPLSQYDDTKGFILDLFGKSYIIFSVATNAPNVEYRAETETDFLRCFFNTNNDSWTVYDKSGTAYYFGETTSTRVSNPKTGWSSGASGTFHWALDQIITACGDWTTISYTTSTNPFTGLAEKTLYATEINYNGHTNNGNGYTKIFSPPDTISFQTEIRTNDWHFSFRSGFRTDLVRRLTNIVCSAAGQNVWSYRLQYGISPATGRSLLTNVVVYGYNTGTATPYLTNSFAYQANPNGVSFGSTIVWTNMILNSPSGANPEITQVNQENPGPLDYSVADLVDIDGDGLPDRLMVDNGVSPNVYLVQKNLGLQSSGTGFFGSQYSFGPVSTGSGAQSNTNPFPNGSAYSELNTPFGRIRDINGDGLPDRVMDYWAPFVNSSIPFTNFTIAFNEGGFFSQPIQWQVVSGVPYSSDSQNIYMDYAAVEGTSTYITESGGQSYQTYVGVGLWDINGDLLPDRVMSGFANYGGMTNLYVEENTGTNFSPQLREFPYRSQNMPNYAGTTYSAQSSFDSFETMDSHFIDLNGDGLPDHLMWPANASEPGGEAPHPVSSWAVEFNDGYSFESTNNNFSTVPGAADLWPGVVAQSAGGGFNYLGNSYWTDSMIEPPISGLWDMNGDGLPDRVVVDQTTIATANPQWLVYLNNGHGFNTNPIIVTNISNEGHYLSNDLDWWSPEAFYYGSEITGLIDINGDGLLDRVLAVYYDPSVYPNGLTANYFLVQLNEGPFPDLLTNVNNGIGGITSVSYKPSTAYDNRLDTTNPNSVSHMPFPRQLVAAVTEYDGVNPPQATTYGYGGGYYDGPRREFHGFAVVTNTDPTLRYTVTYFHTGGGRNYSSLGEYQDANPSTGLGNFAKMGFAYRVETYGNDNELYHVTVNQIDQDDLGDARYFPFTALTLECDYPGNGTPNVTAARFAYDQATGNLTNKVEYGQVMGFNPESVGAFSFADVTSADNRIYKTTYSVISGNSFIVDSPATDILLDQYNNIIKQTDYYYNAMSGTIFEKLIQISPGNFATNGYGNYTSYGLVGQITDPEGVQTTISYDSAFNTFPATATVGGAFTTTTAYDPRSGDLAVSKGPTGLTTSNSFDIFFRPIETDEIPIGGGSPVWIKKYNYPAVLKPISSGVGTNFIDELINDGLGGFTNRTYIDGFGRTIETCVQGENNNFRVVSTAYDGRGNAFLKTWPVFSSTVAFVKPTSGQTADWTGYDPLGRESTNRVVSGIFDSNGSFVNSTTLGGDTGSPLEPKTWSYVNGGNPWWVVFTDEDGQIHRYGLDAYGRTNQIQEVDGSYIYTNLLKYDLADNLTNLINANGENTYWAYNDAGDQVAMADPCLGQWTYLRDFEGRIRVQTDARGDVISNSYVNPATGLQDALGRLQVQTVFSLNYTSHLLIPAYTNCYFYDNSTDANYTVYPGELFEVTDSQGYEKTGYDARTRTIKTTRYLNITTNSFTTTNGYDDGDNVIAIGYPNGGPTIKYSFFHGNSLNQVSLGGSSYNYYTVNANAYDQYGHVTSFGYGSGLASTRTYYPISDRLETVSAGIAGSVFKRTYQYTAGSDISGLSGTGLNNAVIVNYYNLHRIKSFTGLSGNYGYDATGNITNNIEGGGSRYYYSNPRIQAVRSAFGYTNLYDLCGNMMVRHGGLTNAEALVYDPENRLAAIAQAGVFSDEFGYAYDGTRLWKRIDQNPTNIQVWIGNIYEQKGGKTLFHVFAGSEQICTFETNSALYGGSSTNAVGYYYHQDNLNSSSALSGAGGAQVEVDAYYPFGRILMASPQANFQVSRRFTGQVFDAESGLYYYNARYYDPELGRFIQADTDIPDLSNPQSYNRYSYCVNDPLRYTDPTGHSFWSNFNPSLLWDSQVYQGIGYAIMGNTSVRSDPNSYQSLMANSGTPLLTGLTDANGNKLGNPATAVVAAGGGALLQAGMMMGPAGEEKAAVTVVEDSGKVVSSLEQRAKELHGLLDPRAQRMRTTAVTETEEGVTYVSSSKNALSKAQKAALQPGEVAAAGPGHAEITGVNAAKQAGLTPTATAASRPICPTCAQALKEQGVTPASPLKVPQQ